MKKIFVLILPFIFLYSCSIVSIGKQRVYYDEMSKHPEIMIFNEMITVNTVNSNRNSALLIYKIKSNIDTTSREIELFAFQAIGKKYQEKFEVKLKGLTSEQLSGFKFYWIDPDGKRFRLIIRE